MPLLILLIVTFCGRAAVWTPDRILMIQGVRDVQVSPDGRQVAYVISRRETPASEPGSQIWIADADGSHARQLISGKGASAETAGRGGVPNEEQSNRTPARRVARDSTAEPRWSPDGKWLAFVTARSGDSNIWRIRPEGGEPQQLTNLPAGVSGFKWSHNGRWIAFGAANVPPGEKDGRKEKEDWEVVDSAYRYLRLWIVPVEADSDGKREPRLLTPQHLSLGGAFGGGWLDWSPDDRKIVFAHMPRPRFDDWRKLDISEVDIETGATRIVVATEAAEDSPLYSPDGRWIAFRESDVPPHWGIAFIIRIVPASGGGPRSLAETFNREPSMVGWMADSRALLLLEGRGTANILYRLPIDGPVEALYAPDQGTISGLNLNATRAKLGFILTSSEQAPQAFVSEARTGRADPANPEATHESTGRPRSGANGIAPRRITRLNPELADLPLGRTRVIRWKGPGNLDVEGLLTLPAGYREGTKVPLLVISHGGPPMAFTQTYIGNSTTYPIAAFAERGYAVLRSNVRGSTGYGKAFRYANYKDWGGGDFQDMMAGVDAVIAMGIGDPDRLGVMGWSYGGYMTAWTVTQTKRFKAASIGAPITDFASLNGTADMATFIPDYFGGEAWQIPDVYIRHSPLYQAKSVTTPVLLQHGADDTVCPLPQSRVFYDALRKQGTTVRMVIYPRSGHGVSETKLVRNLMEENLEWFDRYCR